MLQSLETRRSQSSRCAFHRDFSACGRGEILPNRDKDTFQLCNIQKCGSAAAEVDGVHSAVEQTARLVSLLGCLLNLGAHPSNVFFEHCARENIGGEIAV